MITYENETLIQAIVEAVRPHLKEGEFIVYRAPFRWMHKDNVISNAYEHFKIETVCEDRYWELIHNFYHVAVVKGREP